MACFDWEGILFSLLGWRILRYWYYDRQWSNKDFKLDFTSWIVGIWIFNSSERKYRLIFEKYNLIWLINHGCKEII